MRKYENERGGERMTTGKRMQEIRGERGWENDRENECEREFFRVNGGGSLNGWNKLDGRDDILKVLLQFVRFKEFDISAFTFIRMTLRKAWNNIFKHWVK